MFKVDVEKILKSQKNKLIRNLPKFAVNYLKRVLREKELNEIAGYAGETKGKEFIKQCMEFMEVDYKIHGKENIPKNGRFIFVSNHPQGGIDFFAAYLSIADYFEKINILANDLLMDVTPLKDIFLPVKVFGKTSKEDKDKILERMSSENIQMMTFPAGLVSRKYNGVLNDSKWHRSFVWNAVEYKRDVIPIFIDTQNSNKFYRVSKIRKILRIKADLELFLLPQELIKQKKSVIDLYFGKPISYETFDDSKDYFEWAQHVKNIVYKLKN